MNPVRKRRMLTLGLMLLAITLSFALVLYALSRNINLFVTPSEIVSASAKHETSFRLGGMVKKGSVSNNNQLVKFIITDFTKEITVIYHGILPDLFREGKGIVAQGRLNKKGEFEAAQVLAKHDENYMPPQLKRKLAKQNLTGIKI